jgi:hypothetical protein
MMLRQFYLLRGAGKESKDTDLGNKIEQLKKNENQHLNIMD